MPARPLAVAVVAAVLVTACGARSGAAGVPHTSSTLRGQEALARADAVRFLDRYVRPDGQVVRPDQGGDTVSEGQSYALLLAEAAGTPGQVETIWHWTRQHLQRPDRLLAYHASPSGAVVDRSAASDADIVTAWALVRSGDPSLRADGVGLARAILDHETTPFDGALVVAAGDWAAGRPASLDPSYWVFPAFGALGRADPDPRWAQVAAGTTRALDVLTLGGRRLPPDWARLDGTSLSDTPAPNRSAPDVRYSFDAQRCLVWMATGHRPVPYASLFDGSGRATAQALAPAGGMIDATPSPVAAVAAAAASTGRRMQLLARADAIQQAAPTYYGAAWVALGRVLLTTTWLSGGPS